MYPTLRDPMDCSLPGSSVHGIFQARVLEWGAIAFSRRQPSISLFKKPVNTTHLLLLAVVLVVSLYIFWVNLDRWFLSGYNFVPQKTFGNV